jgi:hypothetical protein
MEPARVIWPQSLVNCIWRKVTSVINNPTLISLAIDAHGTRRDVIEQMPDMTPTRQVPPYYSDVSSHFLNCLHATEKYISYTFCWYIKNCYKLLFVTLDFPSK